jgi:hypothetical protein
MRTCSFSDEFENTATPTFFRRPFVRETRLFRRLLTGILSPVCDCAKKDFGAVDAPASPSETVG